MSANPMQAPHSGPYLMTVGHFFAILRARWKSIALAILSALVLGVLITKLMPNRYEATATVLVDVKSPDPINGLLLQGMTSPAYMNTQVDLIGSEIVSRKVVRELKLNESTELLTNWRNATGGEGDFEVWAANLIAKHLEIAPARESNLVRVTYTSPSPRFAASVANAYVKAYIETTIDLRIDPAKRYRTVFDTNAEQLRTALETAQKRLSDFQQKHGLIGNEETVDIETARLNDMTMQLVVLQGQASDSRSRRAQAAAAGDQTQESLASTLVSTLRSDLQAKRAKLSELRAQYGENHPSIIQLKANIEELKGRITEETSRVGGGIGVTDNVNQQRVADLKASIETQRAKVMKIKASRDESMILRRDVDSAQKAYDGILARLNQVSLESQTAQTNVSPVGMASPPSDPSSPKLLRNLISALMLGALAGLALALFRELRDQRIRTEEEIFQVLHQPVVVSLPKFQRKGPRKPALLGSPGAIRARRLTA